jgi:hypothetical protein
MARVLPCTTGVPRDLPPLKRDSVVSVVMDTADGFGGLCKFELVVRCDTLLAYADGALVMPTATATAAVAVHNNIFYLSSFALHVGYPA